MQDSKALALAFLALVGASLLGACAGSHEAPDDPASEPSAVQVAPAAGDRLGAALAEYAAAHPCDAQGNCWLNPLPRGHALGAVGGTGPNDVWLAGDGDALHFDGERIRSFSTGLRSVTALWSASPTSVWAVGYQGIAHFDGTAFTLAPSPKSFPVIGRDVWGTSPDDVYAALHEGIAHWDGRAWTMIPGIAGSIVTGTGPADVWVAGAYDGCWHYDGKAWSHVPQPSFVDSVLARAPDDVWMVTHPGRYAYLHHFEGTRWTGEELRQGPPLGRLVQDADGHIWSSGTVARYDGTTWTRVPGATGRLAALGDTLLAVSGNGRIQRITDANPPVAIDLTLGTYEALLGVWASSGSDVWAVGTRGTALHYDGARAQAVETGIVEDLSDVRGSARDDVWAVGRSGAIVHWDGARWTRVEGQVGAGLLTVFPTGRNEAWVGGWEGALLHVTPRGATRVALEGLPAGAAVLDIAGVAADDLWAVGGLNGEKGWLAHYDGVAWSPVFVPTDAAADGRALSRITAHAPNDVWVEAQPSGKPVLDYNWHWDGTRWTLVWDMSWGAPRLVEQDFPTRPDALPRNQLVVDGMQFEVGTGGRFTYRRVRP